jgi:hypothetical protein
METLTTPVNENERQIISVDGGHMFYDKCIVRGPEHPPLFIKGFNKTLFTDYTAAESTKQLLIQEANAYDSLKGTGYKFLPDDVAYDRKSDILYMTAHMPQDGWLWDLPDDHALQQQYVSDVLQALKTLECIPAKVLIPTDRQQSLDELYNEGWNLLRSPRVRKKVADRLAYFRSDFYPHVQSGVEQITDFLQEETFDFAHSLVRNYVALPRPSVAHFDARQSNIAWHPDHGAKLVDWSWASAAPLGADRTMFIIDIFKAGLDVSGLVDYHLEPNYALLQMGHWLARGARQSSPGDNNVRFHQMASAVSAATLLF